MSIFETCVFRLGHFEDDKSQNAKKWTAITLKEELKRVLLFGNPYYH